MTNAITRPSIELAISAAQHEILNQATPSEEIRFRQGRGGRQFPYTDPAYVIRTLNMAFGWDWDFEADNEEILYVKERPFEVRCRGRLTVRNAGKTIIKVQFGCQPLEFKQNDPETPVSLGDAFKGAASDALKKCASLLGIALDLYDSDSDINTQRPGQQAAPKAKNIVVEQPKGEQPKTTNGGKLSNDPMTNFWMTARQLGITQEAAQVILAEHNGNASRAADVLLGMADVAPKN